MNFSADDFLAVAQGAALQASSSAAQALAAAAQAQGVVTQALATVQSVTTGEASLSLALASETARALQAENAISTMLTALQPFTVPFLDAYRHPADPDDTAAFTRGLAACPRLYGTPGATYVVNGVVLNGQQFDGRGCVVRDAPNAPFAFRLTGWRPLLRDVQFQDQGQVAKRTLNAGGFAAAAAAVTLLSATGFAVGQQILVQGNGEWMQTQITAVAGASVSLASPTSEAGGAGLSVVASFGLVHLTDSQHALIEDLLFVNTGVGIVVASTSSEVGNANIRNVQFDGVRYCGFAKYGDVHDLNLSDMEGFCGATDVFTYTGGGVAGAFDCVYPVDLIRDVSVAVNGAAQTYGVHYTFTSDYLVSFLAGNYPAIGAVVALTHYHCGVRGFVEDQRGATVAGGNQIGKVRFLKCLIAMELQSVQLSDYDNVVLDTNMLIGLLVNNCAFDCNFQQISSTWARQPIVAFNSSQVQFANLTTDVTPSSQVLSYQPSGGPELYADATSFIDVDVAQWESAAYTTGGPGAINLFGGEKTLFGSGAAIAAGSTVYLTPFGQAPITSPAAIADKNVFLVSFYAALNFAPGTGQSVTLSVVKNAGFAGAVTLASTTISDGGYGGKVAITPQAVAIGDLISVEAVYSSGAYASIPRGYFVFR